MRPTYLKFRNPKEQTGEYLYPQITSSGLNLTSAQTVNPKAKSTFPKSRRWEHIEEVSRRTGFRVGPGCYNFRVSTNKGIGTVMKPESLVQAEPVSAKIDYVYVGNTLIKQERPMTRSQSQPRIACRPSATILQSQQEMKARLLSQGQPVQNINRDPSEQKTGSMTTREVRPNSSLVYKTTKMETARPTHRSPRGEESRSMDNWWANPKNPYLQVVKVPAKKVRMNRSPDVVSQRSSAKAVFVSDMFVQKDPIVGNARPWTRSGDEGDFLKQKIRLDSPESR